MADAVIFDMDGLLIDSEPFWRVAEVEVLSAVGVPIDDEKARLTTGLRTDEVVEHWFAQYPWEGPTRQEIAAQIVRGVIDLVRTRGEAMPGVGKVLEGFASAGYPLAIASSSASEVISAVLARLGIGDYFRVVQSAEHEPYGKPHPAVYIEAARRLGVMPTRCVAFEDSPNGVVAAKAARMRCIAVPDHALADDKRFLIADAVLPTLATFDFEEFAGWTREWAGTA
jgi:mannitol-1-/sugar-/sorbitol-6-/2-deoxyglucose-6-phosphatase